MDWRWCLFTSYPPFMKNEFDFIAPYYDHLVSLVFGDELVKSQERFLKMLEKGSEVLILGGGTGKAFKKLDSEFSLTFLDKSKKMLYKASKRPEIQHAEFIQSNFLTWESDLRYDYIIAPFFLDCFNQQHLEQIIIKCKQLLKPLGKLLVADFEYGRINLVFSTGMHLFFKMAAGLESNQLLPISNFILKHNFMVEEEEFFFHHMIFSRSYISL